MAYSQMQSLFPTMSAVESSIHDQQLLLPHTDMFRQSGDVMIECGSRYKMSLCNFFYKGRCRHGRFCRFAHGLSELRGPLPKKENVAKKRTRRRKIDSLEEKEATEQDVKQHRALGRETATGNSDCHSDDCMYLNQLGNFISSNDTKKLELESATQPPVMNMVQELYDFCASLKNADDTSNYNCNPELLNCVSDKLRHILSRLDVHQENKQLYQNKQEGTIPMKQYPSLDLSSTCAHLLDTWSAQLDRSTVSDASTIFDATTGVLLPTCSNDDTHSKHIYDKSILPYISTNPASNADGASFSNMTVCNDSNAFLHPNTESETTGYKNVHFEHDSLPFENCDYGPQSHSMLSYNDYQCSRMHDCAHPYGHSQTSDNFSAMSHSTNYPNNLEMLDWNDYSQPHEYSEKSQEMNLAKRLDYVRAKYFPDADLSCKELEILSQNIIEDSRRSQKRYDPISSECNSYSQKLKFAPGLHIS